MGKPGGPDKVLGLPIWDEENREKPLINRKMWWGRGKFSTKRRENGKRWGERIGPQRPLNVSNARQLLREGGGEEDQARRGLTGGICQYPEENPRGNLPPIIYEPSLERVFV